MYKCESFLPSVLRQNHCTSFINYASRKVHNKNFLIKTYSSGDTANSILLSLLQKCDSFHLRLSQNAIQHHV